MRNKKNHLSIIIKYPSYLELCLHVLQFKQLFLMKKKSEKKEKKKTHKKTIRFFHAHSSRKDVQNFRPYTVVFLLTQVREAAYRIYLQPNPHQEELLSNLLKARRALAKLVGFPNFTSRGLKGTLGETPGNISSNPDEKG